jgi:hypothetical protein
MVFFAVSNGYMSTVFMTWGPQRLLPQEQQMGGTMMV